MQLGTGHLPQSKDKDHLAGDGFYIDLWLGLKGVVWRMRGCTFHVRKRAFPWRMLCLSAPSMWSTGASNRLTTSSVHRSITCPCTDVCKDGMRENHRMHSQGHGSVKLLSSVAVASNFPVPDSATEVSFG